MSDVVSCSMWRGEGTRESMTRDGIYDEGRVTQVKDRGIQWDDGWWFGGWPEDRPLPAVGDLVRFYGGIGRPVCGADVNGEPVYFKSVEDEDAEREAAAAESRARKERAFTENEAKRNADYLSLPPELQVRIDSLRRAGGRDWQVEDEPYEMFVCTQAVVIASLGTEEAIRRWNSINSDSPPPGYAPYDFKRQREELPGYDDGHSGNTHGAAVALALMLVRGKREAVLAMPQALSPLAGDPRFES